MRPAFTTPRALAVIALASTLFSCPACVPESSLASAPKAEPLERRARLATGIEARWIELGDPDGEAVLFLHGYTDTSRSFVPTMRALSELRPELRLIALDQRGHGGSALPADEGCREAPETCFEIADFAADALALLDGEGIARAHVVGHSMGSVVAQRLALEHPERVARVVWIGTSARLVGNPAAESLLRDGLVEGVWKAALEARGLSFPADAWSLTPRNVDPKVEHWLAENWVAELGADTELLAAIRPETASVPLGTWIGALRALLAYDAREALGDLRVPTLVLYPIQDAFIPEDPDQVELRAALEAAADAHGTPWFWKRYGRRPPSGGPQNDLGHNLHWAAPEAVARDLAAFLREGGAPTSELAFLEGGERPRVRVEPTGALVLGE